MNNKTITITFNLEDIKAIATDWTEEQCLEFMALEEDSFKDLLIEQGNEYLTNMYLTINADGE
jgi:hypothetical protein